MGDAGANMSGPFIVEGDEIWLSLGSDEQTALRNVPALLDLETESETRLDYTAHPDDPGAEARYRELIGEDLTDLRETDRRAFDDFITGNPGRPDTLEAFMRVVGEARLVLAGLLGIEDDSWESPARMQSDPELALLGWLGYLQDAAVEVLTEFL